MPEREPFSEPNIYQPSVPEVHEAAPEIENKLNNPQFLEEQFRLPKEQWDEEFRAVVERKSEENQQMIKEAEESLGKEFEESPQETSSRSPEVVRQETFERYARGLGLSESWLFDTNLAKDIGMHTYPSGNENMFRSRTFWGQFINREGEINEERVKQFLETGKPPFRIRSGYIPIDEFMDKYSTKK